MTTLQEIIRAKLLVAKQESDRAFGQFLQILSNAEMDQSDRMVCLTLFRDANQRVKELRETLGAIITVESMNDEHLIQTINDVFGKRESEPELIVLKGEKGGECKRTACSNIKANWFNHSTKAYYCGSCADLINDANRSDAMRLYGHELCTLE